MPSARSAALAILASSSPSSVVVKRTWPASVWRWMKVALSGARQQLLAVLRAHLDEIAEHIVVPDLQRAHAGVLGIARLQRGDHPARFVAQRARLVERGVVAGAHEAAVALEMRQLVVERRRKLRRDRRDPAGAAPSAASRDFGGSVAARRRARRQGSPAAAMPSRIAARSRGPPRPTTSRASARARSGAASRRSRVSRARRRVGDEEARPRRAAARSPPDRSAARPAAAPAAASPPPSRCGRWRRAASRAARRTACAPVRDWRAWPGRCAASRPAPRAPAATAAGAGRAACAPHR